MATLTLLDGHSLAYRAYYALPKTITTDRGEMTNATFGFTSMLLDILKRIKPEYIAVAFDVGKTWRHERYEEYKGHRVKAPDELHAQVERVKEVVQTFNIPIFTAQGWEADDVLGTLARQAAEQETDVLIVTGDTDAHQLVTERIQIEQSRGGSRSAPKHYDVAAVEARYDLQVDQLIDYKALLGDSSDNIPGVKGVGKKTATRLLQKYGSLDNIYAHLSELKKGARKKLEVGRENAYLSQELVTIDTAVPGIQLDLEACRTRDFNRNVVIALFRELQFTTLIRRIPQAEQKESSAPAEVPQIKTDYQLVQRALPQESKALPQESKALQQESRALPQESKALPQESKALPQESKALSQPQGLLALAKAIKTADAITLDVETNSVDGMTTKLVGLAVGLGAGKAYYLPIAHRSGTPPRQLSFDIPELSDPRNLPLELVRQTLNPLLSREGLRVYAHNAKFDLQVLRRHGFEVPAVHHDTLIGAWLLNPGSRQINLKSLALNQLGQTMTDITELIGKGRKQITMDYVDVEKVMPYACADVDMTSRLVPLQVKELKKRSLYDLFHDIEMPLVRVLVDIERRGIGFDPSALVEVRQHISTRLAELEMQIYEHAGHKFNIKSTQQLSEVLFNKLALNKRKSKKTKHGSYSTGVKVLEALKGEHPIIELILEQRSLQKLLSTYVDQLPSMVTKGRIHTDFSQTSAETGRLSSSNPNLQNIPTRTELGQQVRRAFVAPPGHILLAADYSQVELRVLAHLSGDDAMIAAFQRGEDIHATTGTLIFDVALDEVTRDQRRIAKAVNFGLLFGMSAFRLARETGLRQAEAKEVLQTYFKSYPSIERYLESIIKDVQLNGYAETLMGRRRYFPALQRDPYSNTGRAAERAAKNHPIQGSAAEIIKIAMINIHQLLRERGFETRMVLQVHDELIFDIPEQELQQVAPLIIDNMTNAMQLKVPLKVDAKIGANWAEMEEF
ncbi:MAG: DNA polymerase I [Ardenticatenaceae bacterium]